MKRIIEEIPNQFCIREHMYQNNNLLLSTVFLFLLCQLEYRIEIQLYSNNFNKGILFRSPTVSSTCFKTIVFLMNNWLHFCVMCSFSPSISVQVDDIKLLDVSYTCDLCLTMIKCPRVT